MKKTFFTAIAISVFGLGMTGCSFSVGTGNNTSNTAATTNTATNTAVNKPANSNSSSNAPKAVLKDEKKPTDGNSKKVKNNPVPESWIDIYDEQKGYSFSVPDGTTGGSDSSGGVDVYVAETPAPSQIGIYVLAFKDKSLTKDDLIETARKFMVEMSEGTGTATMGSPRAESELYSIVDAAIKNQGKSNKARVLVGTDISDNYIMILVCENEEKFAANEKVIDEIWGSFEIWSQR